MHEFHFELRSTEIGRWGVEEFLIICPETDANGAAALTEKIRHSISTDKFQTVNHKTASFGINLVLESEDADSVLKRADAARYKAKNNGRNRMERS